ncbi:hypothetical protein SGPA1_12624 [Streptomyces misionensis JCM 4497]
MRCVTSGPRVRSPRCRPRGPRRRLGPAMNHSNPVTSGWVCELRHASGGGPRPRRGQAAGRGRPRRGVRGSEPARCRLPDHPGVHDGGRRRLLDRGADRRRRQRRHAAGPRHVPDPGRRRPPQDPGHAPAGDYSLTEPATRLNLSTRHLTRLFREELGTTPARYVESIRFGIAKSLLDQGYTATQAASLAGFPGYESLRRVFARELSISPAAYQRRFATTRDAG